MEKLFVWGTGKSAKKFTDRLYEAEYSEIFNISIIGYVDSNSLKWGKDFCEKGICSPSTIKTGEYNYIVIASVYYEEIRKTCIEQLEIDEEKIISTNAYFRIHHAKYQYYKKYNAVFQNNSDMNKNLGRVVVYTANLGYYDTFKDPECVSENVDYVYFTDNKEFKSDIWSVRYIDTGNMDKALLVRKFKFFPNDYFPEYDLSIWVDSKFRIRGDLLEYAKKYMKKRAMLCFPHFERDCVYDEAVKCISLGKGDPIMLGGQIYNYYLENYPFHNGLYEGGCLVRRHHDSRLEEIMQLWWSEINKWSKRDQVSFPYVLWKNDYEVDISDLNILDNEYLEEEAHISDSN